MELGRFTHVRLHEPREQLVAMGTDGIVESHLNLTAEGGTSIWTLETMNMNFSQEVCSCGE